ncbi:hypothetical protein LCGC14_2660560, partial [marine sediment metagenome]
MVDRRPFVWVLSGDFDAWIDEIAGIYFADDSFGPLIEAAVVYTRAVTEAVGFTDSTTGVKSIPIAKSEAIGVIDSTTAAKSAIQAKAEAIGVIDSVASAVVKTRSASE